MERWEQPHWSGRPQPRAETRARLTPNGFARLARFGARNTVTIFALVLFLTALAVGFAAATLRIETERLIAVKLDSATASAEATLQREFPGVGDALVARVESQDAAAARQQAMDLAAALAKRQELFVSAFVPGIGPFYDQYGLLFRDAQDLQARVTRALQYQPIFNALSQSPNIEGIAALTAEIARVLAEGKTPPSMTEFFNMAATSITTGAGGAGQPVQWRNLAGLDPDLASTRWFVIASPQEGQLDEAIQFARQTSAGQPSVSWVFPQMPASADHDTVRNLAVPAILSVFLTLIILVAGLGPFRFVMPVLLTALASAGITFGLAILLPGEPDMASWSFFLLALAPAYVMSIVFVTAHIQARSRGSGPVNAVMMAAQRRGPTILALALLFAFFWASWLPGEAPSFQRLGLMGLMGVLVSLVLTFTFVPAMLSAFDRGDGVDIHWLDEAAATPVGRNTRNALHILAIITVAAALFCAIFIPGLRFTNGVPLATPASLENPSPAGAIHVLAANREEASKLVEAIAEMPETGAIRWADQFLPADAPAKVEILKQLSGYLAPPAQQNAPFDPARVSAALTSWLDALAAIADNSTATPDLREAAARLRQAVTALASNAAPQESEIKSVEMRLFQEMPQLADAANRAASLTPPDAGSLDPDLRRRFISDNGTWRIEVLPKPGAGLMSFAADLRRFTAQAVAGAPVTALALSEILHHEVTFAFALGLGLAALLILIVLRNPIDWFFALLPPLAAVSLSAAVIVTAGQAITPSAIAAAMVALATGLSCTLLLLLRDPGDPATRPQARTGFRAAIIPLAALLGTFAPLAVSRNPCLSDFGLAASLLLILTGLVSLVVLPQVRHVQSSRKQRPKEGEQNGI